MGMLEGRNGLCFLEKVLEGLCFHLLVQDFDSSSGVEMGMFTQVNISKPPLPKQVEQAIVTQLLPSAVAHPSVLLAEHSINCFYCSDIIKLTSRSSSYLSGAGKPPSFKRGMKATYLFWGLGTGALIV